MLARLLTVVVLLVTAVSASAAVFTSDEFTASTLDSTLWTVTNPQADSTISLNGRQLVITVPAGVAHDVWTAGNQAPRVLQPVDNGDFEIVVKFDSVPSAAYQIQGLLVEQDSENFLRFDFYHDGVNVRVFAAGFTNGAPAVAHKGVVWHAAAPLYLRVKRSGDRWVQSYAHDPSTWTTAADFTRRLVVARVGLFAGNAGPRPLAFAARVDYVRHTAAPAVAAGSAPAPGTPAHAIAPAPAPARNTTAEAIAPAAGAAADTTALVIADAGVVAGPTSIRVSWSTDTPATGTVQYGRTPRYELSPVSEAGMRREHELTLSPVSPDTTYFIQAIARDASGNVAATQTFQVRTPPAAPRRRDTTRRAIASAWAGMGGGDRDG